jgi:membrane protein DedA with SNARE-associated domain
MEPAVEAYGLGNLPFAGVIAALFGIVFLRTQLFYWLARGVAAGSIRVPSIKARTESPGVQRAMDRLHRWGAPVVTLSYLTIGFQTAVNVAAGLVRMPFLRYLVAMIPGCVAWAFIYGTIGLGAFYATLALAASSPWLTAAGLFALAAIIVSATIVVRRRRRRAGETPEGDEAALQI